MYVRRFYPYVGGEQPPHPHAAVQPRLTQVERFRQRFMHKLVYGPENNNGLYGCVGCGRCVVKCPSSLHIVQVLRKMRKEEEHAKL